MKLEAGLKEDGPLRSDKARIEDGDDGPLRGTAVYMKLKLKDRLVKWSSKLDRKKMDLHVQTKLESKMEIMDLYVVRQFDEAGLQDRDDGHFLHEARAKRRACQTKLQWKMEMMAVVEKISLE
ncbi:Hypothetical predicted protein [Olea europaea subsp. europaea]|uniref:Uncharacterized protein n=1 Tax=Olea europaea subsp. europaea TaxID=158383 RepID=A0A8S0RIR0_OLEEU|nr:Hypothetical predicted protein [Olea europaea subsp. europaea]